MPTFRAAWRHFAEWTGALLLLVMFAAFLLQVFTRYVLNDPVSWTQEFVLIAYIWIVFWCGAFLLHEREHITFDMAFMALPRGPRRILALFMTAGIGFAFASALPATVDYIAFMKIEKSAVLRIRFDILYAIFAVFMAAVVVTAAIRVVRLAGPSWRAELERDLGGDA